MDENGTDVILDEISGDEIQSVLDTLMGNSSIYGLCCIYHTGKGPV